jgi:LacI family transcriptional regulator
VVQLAGEGAVRVRTESLGEDRGELLVALADEAGIEPGDISVVGYDNIFGADFCSPSLTTLAGSFGEAGRLAVDLLLGTRASTGSARTPSELVLPSHLITRQSTGPAPTHDP